MRTLLFVYGTLMRGCSNHRFLAGEKFISDARTRPAYRVFDVGSFPALVAPTPASLGREIEGELWDVSPEALARLDSFEGVPEGLYRRERVQLAPPFETASAETYVYALDVAGLREITARWQD